MTTGFIGLGDPAPAQLRALLKTGERVLVWDRDAGAVSTSSAAGAAAAPSAEAVARDCGRVIVSLNGDARLGKDDLPAFEPGTVVVLQSSESPDDISALAKRLADRDVHMVDASVSPAGEQGGTVLLASGTDAAWERALPLLGSIGGEVIRCGNRAGDTRAAVLIDRTITVGCGFGALEAMAVGRKMGLSLGSLIDVMNSGSGRNYMTRSILPALVAGKSATDLTVAGLVRDLDQAMTLSVGRAAPTPITSVARGLLQSCRNMLPADAPFAAIATAVERLAGTTLMEGERARPAGAATAGSGEGKAYRVGYVGLGAMGAPLAGRLVKSYRTHVFDVRAENAGPLQAAGAVVAPDLPSLARECDVIFLCLPSSDTVRKVLFGESGLAAGLSRGAVIVDQTTGDPVEAKAIAAELQELGVELVDAPVSGGPENAVAGTTTIICGGGEDAYGKVRPILEKISPTIFYCGPTGSGHAAKLVNNASNICNRLIAYECGLLAFKYGLCFEVIDDVVNRSTGWSFASTRMFKSMPVHGKTATISLELSLKDIWSAVVLAAHCGAPMMIGDAARNVFQLGVIQFGGDANVDEMVRLFEHMGGVDFSRPPAAPQ